jgi:murein DD-endopeptidase MepM/ murein hydrolase activator NlpD
VARRRTRRRVRNRALFASSTVAIATVLGATNGVAGAVLSGYSLPLDQTAFDNNTGPLSLCHHSSPPTPGSTCGMISQHWWAIDLFQNDGASIYSVTSGRVAFSGTDSSCGNYVHVSLSTSAQGGITWQYCHGKSLAVSSGQLVTAGTLLMKMSNSGTGSGGIVHLHNEVRYLYGSDTWSNSQPYYGFCTRRILKSIRAGLPFDYSQQIAAAGPDASKVTYDATCQ